MFDAQKTNRYVFELINMVEGLNIKTIVVVPDLIHAIPFIGKNKRDTLEMHMEMLKHVFQCPMWMPTFSYSTIESHLYDCKETPSEIGIMNEFFRLNYAEWRSPHPIYNFSGTGVMPEMVLNNPIYPYDETSMFHHMNQDGFFLLNYGSRYGTQSRYLLNFIETAALVPYRFDKFADVVIKNCSQLGKYTVCYRMFPQMQENYRGERYRNDLYQELVKEKITLSINNSYMYVDICNIPMLVEYLIDKIKKDPFYLLDHSYIKWLLDNNLI